MEKKLKQLGGEKLEEISIMLARYSSNEKTLTECGLDKVSNSQIEEYITSLLKGEYDLVQVCNSYLSRRINKYGENLLTDAEIIKDFALFSDYDITRCKERFKTALKEKKKL